MKIMHMKTNIKGFEDIHLAKKYYDITDETIQSIHSFKVEANKHIKEFIEDFYKWLPGIPEYKSLFARTGLVEHVKAKQTHYWEQFFDCILDDAYLQSRFEVGNIHAHIKLPIGSYLAGVNFSNTWWQNKINSLKSLKNKSAISIAFNKLSVFDSAIICATYSQETNALIESQSKALLELSTPTIELWDDILILPILGVIDTRRAQMMTDVMLNKIQSTRSRVIIIDITGVASVDTGVANHLIKITKATRLMGCDCILSGIGPVVAQTLVELGIVLNDIETSANLKSAFELALSNIKNSKSTNLLER